MQISMTGQENMTFKYRWLLNMRAKRALYGSKYVPR